MTAQQEPVAALAASASPVDTSPMYKALIEARLVLLAVNSFASQVAIGLIDKVLNAAPDDASAPALQAAEPWMEQEAMYEAQMREEWSQRTGAAMEALRRLERAVDLHLGRSAWTQTKHLKGLGYSEQVRKELYAAHDAARAVLAASAPALQAGQGDPVAQVSEIDGKKCVTFYSYKALHETPLWTKLYASPTHERAAPAPEPVLPYDVTVGGGTFRKGVKLSTFVLAAQDWHRAANPKFYTLTGEEKAENLRRLQDCATPSQPVAAEGMKAWQISERMPSHHRQRTSLENINDVLEVLAASQSAEVVTEFPYTRTFWSIAAAVTIEGPNTKAISVKAFQDEWNRRAAPGSAESKGDGNA